MGRGQPAGDPRRRQRLRAEPPAVTHHNLGPGVSPQLLRQLVQSDGPVRRQAGQLSVFRLEQGVVNLIPPGVHGTHHQPVRKGRVPGHGRQGGHPHSGDGGREGQPLGGGDANPDAGEGPGTHGYRHGADVRHGEVRVFQDVLHNGHQGAAVGKAGILETQRQHPPALRHSGGDRLGGGLQGQDLHMRSTPSTAAVRQFSFSGQRRSVTQTVSGGSASSARSLHSTAQTPPRSR